MRNRRHTPDMRHDGLQLRIQTHQCECRVHRIVATSYHFNFSIKCAATWQPTSTDNARRTARCFTDAEITDNKLILALSKMKERKQEAEEARLDISPEFVTPDDATTVCLHKIKSGNRHSWYLGDKPLPFLLSLAGRNGERVGVRVPDSFLRFSDG